MKKFLMIFVFMLVAFSKDLELIKGQVLILEFKKDGFLELREELKQELKQELKNNPKTDGQEDSKTGSQNKNEFQIMEENNKGKSKKNIDVKKSSWKNNGSKKNSKKNNETIQNTGKKLHTFTHPGDKNKLVTIFALPYKNPAGSTILRAFYKNRTQSFIIKTLQGNYRSENIKVQKEKIFPPKSVSQRIQNEMSEANKIYRSYTDKALFNGSFEAPLNTFITSPYGSARVFNGEVSSFHGGTDFRVKIGVPIKAANDGVVRISKDRYYAGKSVVIDHGYGIYSQYYHLSRIDVKVGQSVKKGEIIGLSGDTGKVSGAHLHFGIFVGGTQVDPLDFIKKFNGLF